MSRTERVELTVLCLVRRGDEYLLQDRVKMDWRGFTLPGGHVEQGESIVDAVVREMKEETGLTVLNPKLCGVKQFPIEQVMLDDNFNEFQYVVEDGEWKVVLK